MNRTVRLAFAALLLCAGSAVAQQVGINPLPDTAASPFRLSLVNFEPRPSLIEPLRFRLMPFRDFVAEWENALRRDLRDRQLNMLAGRTTTSATRPTEPREPAIRMDLDRDIPVESAERRHPSADSAGALEGILGGALGQHADLGMRVFGKADLGGAWTKYSPCDPQLHFTCNPSLFPQLKPDMQFGLQVNGTISDRVHVNVDYDQSREFDAANNISVYYEGREDEILRRVEVGDVSIRMPSSRYLTQGIPAGNFGFRALGQLGPLEFQTVFAQQRGDVTTREFQINGLGDSQNLVQDAQIVLDDADYIEGQFFFLVHPDSLNGTPYIDALGLQAGDAPASLRPAPGIGLLVYRDERPQLNNPQQQAQLGYFLADAVAGTRKHTGHFRRLVQDEHYVIHPSGLWIMLRTPLRADEALAIAYVTETGDTIGVYNAEAAPSGTTPQLRLLRGPVSMHQPGEPTWDYEMHQVYRVENTGTVDPAAVEVRISLGELSGGRTFRDVNGTPVQFLRLFGADEDSPTDQIDVAQIFQPGGYFGGGSNPGGIRPSVTGTFIIFPSLRPFMDPGPIASAGLSAAEARAVLGNDANREIYNNSDPITRESSSRFKLNLKYRQSVEGVASSFSLGGFGIREGSEKLYLGDVQLAAGTDYSIDYDLGMVTLNDAQGLFAKNPGAGLRATWEQKSAFQVAPTSVFGLNARYPMGRRGELNFVGLYQSEKSIMNRPQVGVEPGAIFLGGMSGRVDLGGNLLDRALSKIPGLRLAGNSSFSLAGELALSVPNPNTRNQAYVDDFESADELSLPMSRNRWQLGSAPEYPDGAEGVLPFPLTSTNATRLVWQHDVDANGRITGTFLPQAIDSKIAIAGNPLPEAVLWLTFGDSSINGERRWRSMTTVLSTTGRDMTRSEYLEFYLASPDIGNRALVIDIGTVSEDAFYYDANGNTTGTLQNGSATGNWGLGYLDQEANLAQREIWGPENDALGLWDQPCQGDPLRSFPLGDPNTNCARNNGTPDTEDLDGNGILDARDGEHFRYVIPISELSRYLVRDTSVTKTQFRLFRVPLREGIPVNQASDNTWRFIKHLRLTVTGEPQTTAQNFILARMRVVGSRWTKRDVHGIMQGALGDTVSTSAAGADLQVGPVSQLTDASYIGPDAVKQNVQDPQAGFGAGSIEFNERSLRMRYENVNGGDRAEVYYRYPQQSRGFLTYRQMRIWAVAREGSWGETGDQRLQIRLGNDPRNFYLYQTKLRPPTPQHSRADWLPEIVIDFEKWFDLRQQAEELLARGVTGTERIEVWSEDSTYAVVLEDRARAPNLAALREITFAIHNAGDLPATGEVWINDMRLSAAVRDPGMAGNVSLTMQGGDFITTTLSYANQGALFRQLNQDARFQSTGDLSLSTTAQLGNLLPSGWGLDLPVSVSHTRSGQDPLFLDGTDVRADQLDGLRETGGSATRLGVSLRKRTPSSNPIAGLLLDGLSLRAGYHTSNSSATMARNEASGLDAGLNYSRELRRRDVDAMPSFMEDMLRAVAPGVIENSDFFARLTGARFRWSPARIQFGTNYFRQERSAFQYERILELPGDTAPRALESPRHGMDNDASITFQPFNAFQAQFGFRSSRDLLDPMRASTREHEREAIDRARGGIGGLDLGWETSRSITTNFDFRPDIARWLRPSVRYSARYGTDRNPSYLFIDPADSTALLQRRFQADRTLNRSLTFDPAGMLGSLYGWNANAVVPDSIVRAKGFTATVLQKTLGRLQPVDIILNGTLGSQFERELHTPRLGYQLGFGNMDAFRLMGGDTASYVNSRETFTMRSGVRLPATTSLTFSYEEVNTDAIDQRGGQRKQFDRKWPMLQFNWTRLPLPKFLNSVISSTQLSAGYEHTETNSIFGVGAAQERGGQEDRIPLRVTIAMPRGFSASYTGMLSNATSEDPTGNAEQDNISHAVTLSGYFQPPESWRDRLSAPIAVNLNYNYTSTQNCRFSVADLNTCVPYIDQFNRTLNLSFDSWVQQVQIGFQLSYTSRQNRIGTRTGSDQFQMGFFGKFDLNVGRQMNPGATFPGQ